MIESSYQQIVRKDGDQNIMNKSKLKQIRLMVLVLLFGLMLSGCMNGADFESYMNAVAKTDGIQKGVSHMEISVESTLNLELMNQLKADERETFEKLKSIQVDLTNRFDLEKKQSILDVYFYYNQLGSDIKIYRPNATEMLLKLPYIDGVFDIREGFDFDQMDTEKISNFTKEVASQWNDMLEVENIFVGEKTVIENEDGEVKSTLYTVKPTVAQLDAFMRSLRASVLSHQEELKTFLEEMNMAGSDVSKLDDATYEELVNAIFDSITITRYEETAYVDVDGYIIDEKMVIELQYKSGEHVNHVFETQRIEIHHQNWDIEKSQAFDFEFLDQMERLDMDEETFMKIE